MKKLTLLFLFLSLASLEAAVTALDNAAATTGNGTTLSYPVSAGTNRYLEVGVGCEVNCDSSPTVDIGGQTPVELRTCAVTNLGRITVFGLDEAGIAARTGDLITVSGSGARTVIIARSKQGVNQTNPVPETDCDFTGESTPNPITTSVINAAMNASVSSFAFNGTGSDAAVPPNTCAWVNTTLRHTENGSSEALSFADTFPTVSGNINPQCTWDEQPRAVIVSYEVAPHVDLGGTLTHGSQIFTTEASTITDPPTWVSLFQGTDSNLFTGGTGNYFLFVHGHVKPSQTTVGENFGTRVAFGGSALAGSTQDRWFREGHNHDATRYAKYNFFKRVNFTGAEDVDLEYRNATAASTVYGDSVSMLAFKESDIPEANRAYSENTTTTALTTTYAGFSSASLTASAGDIIGVWVTAQNDKPIGSGGNLIDSRLNINSAADVTAEWTDWMYTDAERFLNGYQRTFTASEGGNTVTLEMRQRTNNTTNANHTYSGILLINLTKTFSNFAHVYTPGNTTVTNSAWTEAATITPTPVAIIDWFLWGAAVETHDTLSAAASWNFRLDDAETDIPTGMEGHRHARNMDGDGEEKMTLQHGTILANVPASTRDWDMDVFVNVAGTNGIQSRSMLAFGMELVAGASESGTSVSTINVYEAIFNSPFVVFPQNLPNGDAGEVYVGATITAIGGATPFTWSISSGSLPTGLSISSTTGEISGTIDAGVVEGNKEFVVQAVDVNGGKATGDFVMFVSNPVDPDPPFEPPPWVQPYDTWTPSTTHYVSPSGTGSGSGLDAANTESWATAKGHYACNHLHILRTGTYETSAVWNPNVDCTSGNMAIFKAYINPTTGQPERAQFNGGVSAQGNWNWFWGLEWTATGSASSGLANNIDCAGCRVINSIVHDMNGSALRVFRFGSGMVIYGNVVYKAGMIPNTDRGHSYYTQNQQSTGRKYFVQNYTSFCDAVGRGQCINMGSSNAEIEAFFWKDNFWWNAECPQSPCRARLNIQAAQTSNINFEDVRDFNFLDNMVVEVSDDNVGGVGLHSVANNAVQGEISGNYFARSNIAIYGVWGSTSSPSPYFTVQNNEVYDPPNGCHWRSTGTYIPGGTRGDYKFMDQDAVDNNTYGGTFQACGLLCNGSTFGNLTLAQWRTNTDNCRVTPDAGDLNGFDINSTVVANPTINKIKVIRNDYARLDGHYRGQVGIVNWENVTSDIVDIAPLGLAGKTYVVRYARDFYGTTAASGTCPGSGACNVTLATKTTDAGAAGQFYSHFIVIGQPDAP